MFSSLASFLFGSNTNCETNSETTTTATATVTGTSEQRETNFNFVDADNLIEVTSLTPSVTGAGDGGQRAIKRGKNKHNNARQQGKRKGIKAPLPTNTKQTKLLIASDNCDEEEFDEDEWFIVGKEDEEEDITPTRIDSEGENVSVIDVAETKKSDDIVVASTPTQQRRLQHINSHSLYSGPRPQKQRNYLQKTRNNSSNRPSNGLSVSTLSPSRAVNDGCIGSGHGATADGSITRSLCLAVTSSSQQSDKEQAVTANDVETFNKMEESWFVTPPPCFTSVGPINMKTSPYENLFIEHPSMSVYHSIEMIQEATEGFMTLNVTVKNLDVNEKTSETTPKKNPKAIQSRSPCSGYHLDRQSVAQIRQELLARNVQKVQIKKEHNDIWRTANVRANKARDIQSRNHTKRRSDRQHSKIFSNANNNRKSNCY